MERYIIRKNRDKLHQTERCPLFHKNILRYLGLMGDGPGVDKVLNGTYIPPKGTCWEVKQWLQQMEIKDKTVLIEITTSLQEYRKGWRSTKERTSSGELHMGHFKARALHRKIGWFNFIMVVFPYIVGSAQAVGSKVQMLCY